MIGDKIPEVTPIKPLPVKHLHVVRFQGGRVEDFTSLTMCKAPPKPSQLTHQTTSSSTHADSPYIPTDSPPAPSEARLLREVHEEGV